MLDILEAFFIANLGLLLAITAYFQTHEWERIVFVYTSLGMSFMAFLAILTYHAHKELKIPPQLLTFTVLCLGTITKHTGYTPLPEHINNTPDRELEGTASTPRGMIQNQPQSPLPVILHR